MDVTVIALLLLQAAAAACWSIEMKTDALVLHMSEDVSLPYTISGADLTNVTLVPECDESIATVNLEVIKKENKIWYGNLNVTGVFLGNTKVSLSIVEDGIAKDTREILAVTVVRQERAVDTAFTASVAILVSVLYINFGCAMDWGLCRAALRKPIAPLIGFFCQFFFMPLSSYFLGYFLFPDRPDLHIGLFFTGISPSGGASNIWTLLLDGNLSLSVTMTTLCTFAAFGMMPFWTFTLGKRIFERGQIVVPYSRMATLAIGLVIPLAIGYWIQKKFPKLSQTLVRVMKPFSAFLIVFIVIFAIFTNLYLFKLFSLQIIIAGMGLPWLGFLFGLTVATLLRQPWRDIKAISLETGIQNTGVSIFLLRFTLPAPAADLTTVVPVSAAIMTPLPLILIYVGKSIYNWSRGSSRNTEPSAQKLRSANEISTISTPFQD